MPPQYPSLDKIPEILHIFQPLPKTHRCLRNDLKTPIYLGLSYYSSNLLYCSYFIYPLTSLDFCGYLKIPHLESLGLNPAKHLSTGIAPLHSLFMSVFCKNRILIPTWNKWRLHSFNKKEKREQLKDQACWVHLNWTHNSISCLQEMWISALSLSQGWWDWLVKGLFLGKISQQASGTAWARLKCH